MPNKTFKEVQEFLKGKIILVANRGIPARRICRSIRERFDAIAAMTATDIDKTAPSASTAQKLLLLGPDPRAYLDIERIVKLAKRSGVVGMLAGATAVQVGAANLTDPMACKRIIDDLPGVLERLGVNDINELIGGAH